VEVGTRLAWRETSTSALFALSV
jgi:hypothetical protein